MSILTKSDLLLRDLDLLKQFKKIDINFTINTLDEKWQSLVEPDSPTVRERLIAAGKLTALGIPVIAMMGPYFPVFTDPEKLFSEFKKAGIKEVFTESFNTTGGNFVEVEEILKKHYPHLLPEIRGILFDRKNFYDFYSGQEEVVRQMSKKYKLPATIYFGLGHAAKFK